MSLALARKYRPKRFADVAVQSHVSATLKGAIARGRVAHGYLLCGPRGVGKTTLARVLAMALNCERRGDDGEPCGECDSCRRIWSGSASLDVVEIDAASNRGVDDARDLRERAMYAPSGDERYKVYIVDEAHMLTREAWNALLKVLEEPPPRVVFVFATTEPQKIAQSAAPVLSRLQRLDFKRIGPADVRDRLTKVLAAEGIAAEDDALAMIARAADGSMRDALSLTDQVLSMGGEEAPRVTEDRVREALGLVPEDEYIALLDLVADRRAADVFPFVGRLAEAGVEFSLFLAGLADILRAQLALVLGGTPTDLSEHTRQALEARRDRFGAADLLRMMNMLAELEPRFRKSGQQQLLLETLLVRFALLDRSIDIEEVLRGLASGGVSPPARPSFSQAAPRSVPGAAESPDAPRAPSPPAERAAPAARRADPVPREPRAAAAVPAGASLDLNRLVERWDALIARLRADNRLGLATAVEHAMPAAVTAAGDVTLEMTAPNEFLEQRIQAEWGDIAAILREWFAVVGRVQVRRGERAGAGAPRRLTDEMVREERLAALRKRDPALNDAVEVLDLDVVD